MKFRKKPVIIEATQWWKMGDHPAVKSYQDLTEGKCESCGQEFRAHGLCLTLEGDLIVCPGDWVITGVKGETYPCKPDIFALTYEPVET